jgi:hypothetical protein
VKKFEPLTDKATKKPVYINTDLVVAVKSSGAGSEVFTAGGHLFIVIEPAEDVLIKLETLSPTGRRS